MGPGSRVWGLRRGVQGSAAWGPGCSLGFRDSALLPRASGVAAQIYAVGLAPKGLGTRP